MLRCVLLAVVFFSSGLAARAAAGQGTAAACLTTVPQNPPFVPPLPYAQKPPNGTFWYGTESLWTGLPIEGTWSMRDNVLKGNGYRTKLVYWQQGFDWRKTPHPELIVEARRLDSGAHPVAAEHSNAVFVTSNTPAIMTAIDIPTAGCWELTAQYGGHTLRFVVSVQP